MRLFSEDVKEFAEEGVVGMELTIRSKSVRPTPALVALAEPFRDRCGDVETAFNIAALSEGKHPTGLYLMCHGHLHGDEPIDHFYITIKRRPSSNPPDEIVKTSAALGGYYKALDKLLAALDSQEIEASVSLAILIADSKKWAPLVKVRKLPAVDGFKFEESDLSFASNDGKCEVVISCGEYDKFSVEISDHLPITLDSNCLNNLGNQLWSKVSVFFRQR